MPGQLAHPTSTWPSSCSKGRALPLEWDPGGGAGPTCGVQQGESTNYSRMGGPYPAPPFPSIGSFAPPKGILGFCSPPAVHSSSHAGWSQWGGCPKRPVPPSSLRRGSGGGPESLGSDASGADPPQPERRSGLSESSQSFFLSLTGVLGTSVLFSEREHGEMLPDLSPTAT